MKLAELKEMALRGGDFREPADNFVARFTERLKGAPHVGDIDEYQVKSNGTAFSLWKSHDMVAMLIIDVVPHHYTVVDNLWVRKEFRGKKLLSKLLWFLKSRENHKKLLLGKVHSDDTHSLLKAGGLSLFKKSWHNLNTGKVEEFNPATIDYFYGHDKSEWNLMLEGPDNNFYDMPRFNTFETGFVTQTYDWQVE